MTEFDDMMNNFQKRNKEYEDNIKRIDDEYEKRKKEIEKKHLKIIILFCVIVIFLNVRNIIMLEVSSNFKEYARDYSLTIKESPSEYYSNIIYKKILPRYISSFFNPLEWTEKQISKDDDLLRKCKTEYEIKERERQLNRIEAERTFNERIKE